MPLSRALAAIIIVFVADQISKWWIVERIMKPAALPREIDSSAQPFLQWLTTAQEQMVFVKIELLPFFNLVMVWNKGISFGMFNNHGALAAYAPLILIGMALLIAAIFAVWLVRTDNAVTRLALALVIGGALGNAVDRARFGAVADFLDFHLFGLHWPAFNVADSAIAVGIATMLIHGLFFDRQPKEAKSS